MAIPPPRATSTPFPSNNTADIYRAGTAPPSAPAISGVRILIVANKSCPTHDAEDALGYSHFALVAATLDVRDNKSDAFTLGSPDILYVPDKNGTPFKVNHVELRSRNTPSEHKKLYLDRGTPPWPTNDV